MKVCFKCGVKYLREDQMITGKNIWFSEGKCVECREDKPVTDARHYNNLKKE